MCNDLRGGATNTSSFVLPIGVTHPCYSHNVGAAFRRAPFFMHGGTSVYHVYEPYDRIHVINNQFTVYNGAAGKKCLKHDF